MWSQKFARELDINSPELFNQACNEWVGVAAINSDLIDPNLIFINSIKINQTIFDNINNIMSEFNQIPEDQRSNEKLNQIIPNVLPDSFFKYDFIISNSPLNNQFFEQFDKIYKNFEINLNQINQFEVSWKNFIQKTNDIYVSIADTFWENRGYLRPNNLRKAKIRLAKSRMFSEAQKIKEMENVPKPTKEQTTTYRLNYHSMAGIPGLQDISGKIFLY